MSGLAGLVGYGSDSSEEDQVANSRGEEPGETEEEGDGEEGEEKEDDEEEDGDEDEDEDEEREPSKGEPSCKPISSLSLPSADDLFSTTSGPKFLAVPSTGKEFEVKTLKKRDGERNDPRGKRVKVQAVREAPVLDGKSNIQKYREGDGGSSGVHRLDGGTGKRGGKESGKEKLTAKDRVKGQRLRGQSGIGSDFRTWKSDLEMTMRQQYD